ncbi:MAG: hypothetical protein MUC96_27960 [Myxococcaceae bacterium]|nr:hypothetical protein [Myxococcaceae bacterium]
MRSLLVLSVVVMACAAPTALSRARGLEADGAACDRFSTFEPKLAKAREALPYEASGAELVPASQALSAARQACARVTVDRLLELQQREGRQAAATEVQALTKAFGAAATLERLTTRWGPGADQFAPDVSAAAYAPGPTPEQPAPTEPDDPRRDERPTLPSAADLGRAAECLRRATAEAASCLGEWNRDGADAADLDAAVKRLVTRVEAELTALPDERRAEVLGQVFSGLGLSSDRPVLAPLVKALTQLASRVLPQAEQLASAGVLERAATLARPFLSVDVTRRRAEALCRPAARKHHQLAADAGPRPLARAVHLSLAAHFVGERLPLPPLEPGRWDTLRWDCPTPKPTMPALPAGAAGRLVAFCRKTSGTAHATQAKDASMRTFEFESSLQRVEVRADVAVTCGGKVTTKRLEASDMLLDLPSPESRPGPLDGPLTQLVREVSTTCRQAAEADADAECRRLSGDALDVTQTFARHAQRLGAWPECFVRWFRTTYDMTPPPVSSGP